MITFIKKLISPVLSRIAMFIGNISWPVKNSITTVEKAKINELLTNNYYIILTRHNGNLSTYAISFAHWLLTFRKGYYAHALMNLEDIVEKDDDFRFIESTDKGTHYSGFDNVFDNACSSVALLKPKYMTLDEWTSALDHAKVYLGRPYDTLFDLANDNKLSCVELVRESLKGNLNYSADFVNFEKMIAKEGNLDPQMFLECSDFEIEYEVRH